MPELAAAPVPCGARLPGDSGVWFFIVADLGMFAIFFLLFSVGRASAPEMYEESRRTLNSTLGLLNTLFLLTSSWFMALAVQAAHAGKRAEVKRYLLLAIAVGSGFIVTKIIEYSDKVTHGITLATNEFFGYYFAYTGIHFLHFAVGLGFLLLMLARARREALDGRFIVWIESVGCYWHLVDLLWIMLFAMIYLLRGA